MDHAWKNSFKRDFVGVTLVAISKEKPWLFVVTDYRGLLDLHRIQQRRATGESNIKISKNMWACLHFMFSLARPIDLKTLRVTPLTRVEMFYNEHRGAPIQYAGFIKHNPIEKLFFPCIFNINQFPKPVAKSKPVPLKLTVPVKAIKVSDLGF